MIDNESILLHKKWLEFKTLLLQHNNSSLYIDIYIEELEIFRKQKRPSLGKPTSLDGNIPIPSTYKGKGLGHWTSKKPVLVPQVGTGKITEDHYK